MGTFVPTDAKVALIDRLSAPGLDASDTREFDDCGVGRRTCSASGADGFRNFLIILDAGRVSIEALGVGLARDASENSVACAKERKRFGKPIVENQAIVLSWPT